MSSRITIHACGLLHLGLQLLFTVGEPTHLRCLWTSIRVVLVQVTQARLVHVATTLPVSLLFPFTVPVQLVFGTHVSDVNAAGLNCKWV